MEEDGHVWRTLHPALRQLSDLLIGEASFLLQSIIQPSSISSD